MTLPSFPDNPIPPGCIEQAVVTVDGVTLRTAIWRPSGRARGTICLLHGRAESIEKYFEVAGELLGRGFAVATFDWRGQGGSERRLGNPLKGHVDDFIEYERDVEAFLKQVALPDCPPPFFALAHSTGGLVALRVARRSRLTFSRMVLSAPLLDFGSIGPSSQVVGFASGIFNVLGLSDAFLPRIGGHGPKASLFANNALTSDERRFARVMSVGKLRPDLMVGRPTIGWLSAACRAMSEARTPAFATAIKIPTLILAAGEDRVVSSLAIERFTREMRLGTQLVIPGSRHEIMMERDPIRSLFWAAFDAFIPGESA